MRVAPFGLLLSRQLGMALTDLLTYPDERGGQLSLQLCEREWQNVSLHLERCQKQYLLAPDAVVNNSVLNYPFQSSQS